MNNDQIIQEVLKKSTKTVSKKKFNSKIDFESQVGKFIGSIKSNLVKLRLVNSSFNEEKTKQPYQHWQFKFEIVFVLDDPYIDGKVYEKGSIYIFPARRLYADVQKKCMSMFEASPLWNEEDVIATVTGKARAY